ncbi:hypothetical protein J14TS5_58060 [Paenibacillus lautus]|nr:hypothetical protein J14TS5_58060 [Paenibacillus lautus]
MKANKKQMAIATKIGNTYACISFSLSNKQAEEYNNRKFE